MATQKWSTKKKTIVLGAVAAVVCIAIVIMVMLLTGNVSLFIDPQEITMEVGQTYQLSIFSADGEKEDLSAKWNSDTAAVASVDKNGVVTAKGPGRAMISAVVKKGGKEYVATTQVTVWEEGGVQVAVDGDKTQGPPDFRGEKFTVLSATDQVTYDMTAGTIQIPKSLKRSEIIFSNSRNYPCVENWDLQGTLTRSDLKDTCFLSVGVIDETGKEQWFCLYGTGLSRQRYWNWKETEYQVDNVYVGFNKAAESFYKRETADGNRLDFRVVLIGDTLKVYFGNAKEAMSLAWSLPLTQSTWGGFEKGSKYQLAINTVDPCDLSFTDVTCVNGEDVKDPGGIVGGKYADVKIKGDKFKIAQSSVGVSYNAQKGIARIQATVKQTEMFYAGNDKTYTNRWEMSGTITKEKLSDTLFLSFGVRDAKGKTQWFCIYQNTLSLQKEWNWADTKQKVDGTNVKFNQAACSFFWKEKNQGAEKLNYKLILHDDILTVYFGNDKYPLSQAWYIPLTEKTYGGFAAGSGYQLGMATVDPLNMDISNIIVKTGAQAAVVPEYVEGGKFVLSNKSVNVESKPKVGLITVKDTEKQSQVLFAASPYMLTSSSWELSGTVTKQAMENLFLSFGVKDSKGKEQWFCVYQKGLARQRGYNWADTAQPVDNVYVFANPASEHFFYKTPALGGDKLHFKLVLKDDTLKAYFGNDMYDMGLAWCLPLTEELWGGFAAGSKYQLGINTVDPCPITISDISVTVGKEVSDADYVYQLYDVSRFATDAEILGQKLVQQAKDGVTTVFIGDSFFHEAAFFKNFSEIYAYQEALCLGHSTTTTYHWVSFLQNWLYQVSPKNLVVNVGTNNLTVSAPYNSVPGITAALQEMLTLLKKQFPNTNIYWFSLSARNDLNREADRKMINEIMRRWCAGNGIVYVESPVDDPATDCIDGLHPTGDTYQQYAQALAAAGCVIEKVDISKYQFFVDSSAQGVVTNPEEGRLFISNTVSKTETMFKANADAVFAETWQLTGTVTKQEMKNLFLSFGIRDESGKEQWFCIYQKGLARQRYYNWADTRYGIDNKYVYANAASEHFFYKTPSLGGDKLHYKLVIRDDVLKAYFGNDQFDMTLAWQLPLTEELWGGFAAGSRYQMGINTVDPCAQTWSNVQVLTGEAVPEEVKPDYSKYQFFVDSYTNGITPNPEDGTITISNSASKTETMFAANADEVFSDTWQITGTVTKEEMNNLFLSFGLVDESGKEQWFCIYGKGLSRQRYWDWSKTKYDVDNKYVFANPATEHFYYKTPSLGGDKLKFAIVVQDDVLRAYFGNDQYDMTLAWELPLTEELWGSFAAGSKYQMGINTVDPCAHNYSNVKVVTGSDVNDTWYAQQLGDVSGFEAHVTSNISKLDANAKDGVTTVFIGDSFFHQSAFFKNFDTIYRNKEAVCIGISTTTTYQWETFTKDWLKNYNPKNIVVNLGTNNMSLSAPFCSNENVVMALQSLLSLLKEKFPNTNIYWISISPRTDMNRDADKVIINDQMKIWCNANGVTYVQSPVTDPAADCVDGLHPTAATYEKYAQALVDAGCEIVSCDTTGYQYFVDSASSGVTTKPEDGTITISNSVSKTETMFAANADEVFSDTWQITGTVTKNEMKNLFLSFGIRDESGKEQWFCIYDKGLSRQRYWNWADTKYAPDGKYVIANAATEHFYHKTPSLGGDKLHYKLVIRDDVLKAYFGNDQFDMTLAWQLPLTEALWGGFAAGSKYQLGINTVDPCAHTHSGVQILTGDAVPEEEKPDYSNYKFFVDSYSNGVTVMPEDGTITVSDSVSKSETMFMATADAVYDAQWKLTGTVTKPDPTKNLFLSFGLRDETGKEQWFCLYQKGLSRQRYWNWANTSYQPDGKYVIANAATEHFFYKTPSLGGDKLYFEIIVENDLLKAYFGNDQFDMTLAWQLPLTEELWGGFAAGSKYQLGINSVDPCVQNYTDVSIVTGDAVEDTNDVVDTSNYKFIVASAADGVTADPENGTIQISNSVSKTETMFAASADSAYSDTWQLTGTVTKNEMKNLFLSFGVRTEDGKEQWFCLYQKGLARQRYWNWANTSYQPDGKYVIANPASEHFFYKTPSLGGDKLHFKIVIVQDVLKAYFGNDMYDMTLAWQLPLTEELWGGFAAGSSYQLGINTVDPCSQSYSNVAVVTGEGVTDEDSGQEEEKTDLFYLDSATAGVTADPQSGTITISNSVSKSETMFKANSQSKYATNWELTGTITKKEHASQFFSFGIRDENGKEQWFCIYQKGLARQRYWNWANTKQSVDDVYVFANPASEHFFYQTYGLGGDTLHFKIVIENDVFKAYFGSNQYEMSLAWQLPLTEELWGGFAAGTAYQLGLNSVDACSMVISNVKITTSTVVKKAISPILAILPPKPEEEAVNNSDNA